MAATLTQSEFVYRSGATAATYYYFTVIVDENSNQSVRNIQTPNGLITDSMADVPESVVNDIVTAFAAVEDFLASTSAVNGSVVFAASTSEAVVFATALGSANYSVYIDSGEFTVFKIESKTTAGFTITAPTTFTGTIRYDVFI